MGVRLTHRLAGGAFLWLLALAVPLGASSQVVDSVTVRVRQVAGENLYLDIGSNQGLAAGDTIPVSEGDGGDSLGRVVVVGTSEDRSVLAFAGQPFPVQAGDAITVGLLRPPKVRPETEPGEEETVAETVDQDASETEAERPRPAPYGRISAEVSGLHSTTTVGGADPIDTGRSFATPAFRLDLTIPEIFAGFQLRTNVRLAYRYSSDDVIAPASQTRIYNAVLERRFASVPVDLRLGRFRSTAESYSGYTDGLFLRYGERSLGVGFLVGFQPDRWDERPSVDRPKVSVFLDGERRGDGWWWRSDLSAHVVMGAESERDHRFLGLSQRIGVGDLLLSEDLQVDQDPAGGNVSLSYLRLQGSLGIARGWRLRAGFTRRRSFRELSSLDIFGPTSDRVLGGLSYGGAWGGLGVDVSTTTRDAGSRATGYQGYVNVSDLGFWSLAGRIGASYWTGDGGNTVSLSSTLTRSWRDTRLSLGYRLYRSDYLSRQSNQHGIDATLDVPLGNALRASVLLRTGLSDTLRSEELRIQLSRIF